MRKVVLYLLLLTLVLLSMPQAHTSRPLYRISYGIFIPNVLRDDKGDITSLGEERYKEYFLVIREYMEEFLPSYFAKYLNVDVEIRYLCFEPRDYKHGGYIGLSTNASLSELYETGKMWKGAVERGMFPDLCSSLPLNHFTVLTNAELRLNEVTYGGLDFGDVTVVRINDWVTAEAIVTSLGGRHPYGSYNVFMQRQGGLLAVSHELTHFVFDMEDGIADLRGSKVLLIDDGLAGGVYLDKNLEVVSVPTYVPRNWVWVAQRLVSDQPCQIDIYPCLS